MRKILLLPAMLLSCSAAFAGENGNANTTGAPVIGGMFPHFSPGANGAGVPTTQNFRLIAKAHSVYNDGGFVAVDSITYQYGSGRGGVPNPDQFENDEQILFDISTKFKFNANTWGYVNNQQREQYYTAGNSVNQLIYKDWDIAKGIWKYKERYRYEYDQATGKMERSVFEQWYGRLWTNGFNSTLTYDASNQNVISMVGVTYKAEFKYDNNNNLTEWRDYTRGTDGIWTSSEKKTYTYSGTDVTSYTLAKWIDGVWRDTKRWEYTLDANGNVIKEVEYTWDNGTGWLPYLQHEYSYDNNENKTQDITYTWNLATSAFDKYKREEREYNAQSLPVNIRTYTWKGQSWVNASGDYNINYYYQQYTPSSVPVFVNNAEMAIYPIPARDIVNITLNWDSPAPFTVSILDMGGKTVYQQAEQATSSYKGTIPVGNLPAGNYAVLINSEGANISKKLVVAY